MKIHKIRLFAVQSIGLSTTLGHYIIVRHCFGGVYGPKGTGTKVAEGF